MSERQPVAAEAVEVGERLDDERFPHVMDVGHITVGPKWVTFRAFHPDVRIYPKTAYRVRRGEAVTIRKATS